jgi:hypothetical protein
MLASHRPPILPPVPPVIRFGILGVVVAVFAWLWLVWQPEAPPPADPEVVMEATVAVPPIDRAVLAQSKDATREQRLMLELEPLRHLLGHAINVGPTVAYALDMPERPVPLAELRADPDRWRGRWLWYEGVVEELNGPRDGHPIQGYSIYETTLKLADDERVVATFSIPPAPELKRGSWVRVEGYLMKLRDTTYPHDMAKAPLLVGRAIQRDYEDWGPVTELRPELLAGVDDTSFWPGTKAWHTIEEDQTEPLWHLAAFARDVAGKRSLAEWRQHGTLNEADVMPKLRANTLDRGTPMRVLGTLIRRTTIAAPANPAGIDAWTVVDVQVRDFGGHLIPIWIPKRATDLPNRADVEVRGLFYRWFAYEGRQGDRFRVPLFVAADLDAFHLETGRTMQGIGTALAGIVAAFVVLVWRLQRRAARDALAHSREMDARRRRRRERGRASSPPAAAVPPSAP